MPTVAAGTIPEAGQKGRQAQMRSARNTAGLAIVVALFAALAAVLLTNLTLLANGL